MDNQVSRICRKCGLEKPLEQFYVDKRTGKHSWRCDACRAAYGRAVRKADPEKYRAWSRDYRAKNKTKLNAQARALRAANPGVSADYNVRWRRKDPARALLTAAKSRATKYGIEFSITIDDIVVPDKCPVLGLEFGPNTGRGRGAYKDSISLDRIDCTKGYVPGNVQVMSRLANTMKSNATKEQLLMFADWVGRTFG